MFQKIDLKYDPIIFINYSRLYFISDICPIRATIDYNLSSIEFMGKNLKNEKKVFQNIILEFKYDLDFDENFRNKINKLNLRFSKNSKYVNSIIEYPDFYSL